MTFSPSSKVSKLVIELKRGNVLAFNALFEEYNNRLYYFALHYMKNEAEAEELVQEVFTRIWEARSDLKEELSFHSYIFTIAFNIIRKHFRKKALTNEYLNQQVYIDLDLQTTQQLDYNSLHAYLEDVVNMLPEKRKKIFQLSRFEGLKTKEIANELNISTKTVENQLTDALKFIRKKMGQAGFGALLFYYFFTS
jgi:RNA polymerase sigma-70 factor (family 1)